MLLTSGQTKRNHRLGRFIPLGRERFIAPVVLLALTIGVHWKTLLTTQYSAFDSPDATYQIAPWMQVQAAELHKGHWPLLWDPYVLGGHPLLGQGQPGVMFPLNWLLFATPLHQGFITQAAMHWYMALIRFIAAMAMYALCRDLARSRIASIFAGAAFAFAGYMATTGWPQMLNGGVLAPLVILFSLRALRGDRQWLNAALSGGFLGLSWLSGHHQIPIFVTLAVSGIWIFHILQKPQLRSRAHTAGLFAVLLIVMLMGGAAQTFPGYSYAQDVVRWVGASHELTWKETVPYSVHDSFALTPAAILGIFIEGIYSVSNPFVGITVFLLAIFGVVLNWKTAAVRILLGIGLGALVFAFSSATIFHGIVYALVPFVEKARDDAMAEFVFHLAICALSAFGLDAMLNPEILQSRWLKRASIAAGGVALLMWLYLFGVYAARMPSNLRPTNTGLTALSALLIVCILYAARPRTDGGVAIGTRTAAILLTGLMLLEVGNLVGRDLRNRDAGQGFWSLLSRDADIARFLHSRRGSFRVDFNGDDIPYNFGDWYGVESYWGYLATAPASIMRVFADPRAKQLFGVRYYVGKAPSRGAEQELFSSATTGIKVFDVPQAMPRAWVVHDVAEVARPDIALGLLDPSFDMARSTFLPGKERRPQLDNCGGDQARVVRQEPEFVAIQAKLECRGMVILGDAYSRDWVATVDGTSVPLYAAYALIRGVVAPAGEHRIELRYRPGSFYLGASLSVAALMLILAMWFFTSRPQAQRES